MKRGKIGEIKSDRVIMINPTDGRTIFHAFNEGGNDKEILRTCHYEMVCP